MLDREDRQRTGRALLWLMLALLIVAVIALALRPPPFLSALFDVEHVDVDESRLQKLQTAPLPAPPAPAETNDWPQWRGPRRDGISLETIRTDWPEGGPPVLWQAKSGRGFSSFAISGGRLYTLLQDGANEAVVCWNAESGAEVWRRSYAASFAKGYPGPRATPTIAGGKVYTIGVTGMFHCLDAGNGEIAWSIDLVKDFAAFMPEWGIACSPLVDGERVFVIVGGKDGNGGVAFDRHTGKKVWGALEDISGYSSPMLATLAGKRTLVCFTGKAVVGLAADDGTLYWRYEWTTQYDVNAATPIIAGDYVFISSNYGKGCALLEIVDEGGTLQARRVYQHNRMRNHFCTSILYKDHLYGFDDDMLACMEFRTGKVRWKQRGFGKGSLLLADDQLIVLSDRGKLALAAASPEAYQQKATFQAITASGPCWTLPVVHGGRLYLRGEEELICFDVRKP